MSYNLKFDEPDEKEVILDDSEKKATKLPKYVSDRLTFKVENWLCIKSIKKIQKMIFFMLGISIVFYITL